MGNEERCKNKENEIQKEIYRIAKANIGCEAWSKELKRRAKRNVLVVFGEGEYKCNLFVYEVLFAAGYDVGTNITQSGPRPPTTKNWFSWDEGILEDLKKRLIGRNSKAQFIGKGEEGFENAKPGDVITDGCHLGIISENDQTISASAIPNEEGKYLIVENQWGYRWKYPDKYPNEHDNADNYKIFRCNYYDCFRRPP